MKKNSKYLYYRRKRRRQIAASAILILLTPLLISCGKANPQTPLTVTDYQLNTIVSLQVYDDADPDLLSDALALCGYYEKIFSRTAPESELYLLNEAAGKEPLQDYPVSTDLYALLEKGLYYSQLSGGAFDITVEPVSSLWDFQTEMPAVPADSSLHNALDLTGYDGLALTEHGVSLLQAGMGIDLGAAAKGYIADRIRDRLLAGGVEHAVINLGGNVLCIGSRPDGTAYRIGVRTPFGETTDTSLVLGITDQAVVTTGIYERYFEQDAKLYHHIINPQTGYPYDNGIASVTIIADNATDADLLSTTCFALGLQDGLALVEDLPGVEAAWIMTDGSIRYSNGFEAYVLR